MVGIFDSGIYDSGIYDTAPSGGSVSLTLDPLLLSASARALNAAVGVGSLEELSAAATAAASINARATLSLSDLSTSSVGGVQLSGSATILFEGLGDVGSARVVATAVAYPTFDSLAITQADGRVIVSGVSAVELAPVTVAGVLSAYYAANSDITLGSVTLTAAGSVAVHASGLFPFDAATLASTGVVLNAARSSIDLTDVSAQAETSALVQAAIAATFGSMAANAGGTVRDPQVSCQLVDPYGNPLRSLDSLSYAWFDQTDPVLLTAPVETGAVETTDGDGVIIVPVPNTALTVGQPGLLVLRSDDGSALGAYNLTIQ